MSRPEILITSTHVDNITDAYTLVSALKKEGKYDIFRGQAECWPLSSSISRLDDLKLENAYHELSSFAHWVHRSAGLTELANDKDKLIAVAQHYGIPTSLIDFTYDPEVAFFFADGGKNNSQVEGCIYCCSKTALYLAISSFKRSLPEAKFRIVELEVGNLWRLQSQKGLFFDAPIAGLDYWEDFFPFHKVIFPHTKPLKKTIPHDIIYPKRKSGLEIKLDQHFREQQVQKGLKEFTRTTGNQPYTIPWASNFTIFKDQRPFETDREWHNTDADIWNVPALEIFETTVGQGKIDIDIKEPIQSPFHLKELFILQLKDQLEKNKLLRNFTIEFEIKLNYGSILWTKEMTKMIESFWDGVRRLPYTNEELCEGLSNLVIILYCSMIYQDDYISYIFGKTEMFECLIKNGGHFRVALPVEPLKNVVKASLFEMVDLTLYPKITDMSTLIHHIHETNILFYFKDFRKFFIEFLIPCQIITNFDPSNYYSGGIEKSMVIYSPFEVQCIRSALSYFTYEERYRFKEKIFPIHPVLSDEELILIMAATLDRIEKGEEPLTVVISGYEKDPRELYEIPEVSTFCQRLLSLGFISVQEVVTHFRDISNTYDPYTFGAFEIWLIAKGKMKRSMYMGDIMNWFNDFYNDLLTCNQRCDDLIKNAKHDVDEARIDRIREKGIFGKQMRN